MQPGNIYVGPLGYQNGENSTGSCRLSAKAAHLKVAVSAPAYMEPMILCIGPISLSQSPAKSFVRRTCHELLDCIEDELDKEAPSSRALMMATREGCALRYNVLIWRRHADCACCAIFRDISGARN